MNITSEYKFPIFISSTHYNLIDFRAELSHYLYDLGYEPKISSAAYFHDKYPDLEPWESCLPVLDNCFVMILILDGKYGTALNWESFPDLPKLNVKERTKISPTHGEYLFAHNKRKRMLVFVRTEIMTFYQSYRKVMKKYKNDRAKAKEVLSESLPDQIEFEALEFLNEVKTSRPIPWIKEFDDVTSVKKEVHKKMLNELAEIFMVKEKKADIIMEAFYRIADELTPKQKEKFLDKINVTKEISKLKEELEKAEKEVQKEKKSKSDLKSDNAKEIKQLKNDIKNLESLENSGYLTNNNFLLDSSGNIRMNPRPLVDNNFETKNFYSASLSRLYPFDDKKCEKCDKVISNTELLSTNEERLRKCHYCNKDYCSDCWPENNIYSFINDKCPKCRDK